MKFLPIIFKYYLYNQKMRLEQCNFDHFISVMEQKIYIENYTQKK